MQCSIYIFEISRGKDSFGSHSTDDKVWVLMVVNDKISQLHPVFPNLFRHTANHARCVDTVME